MLYPLRYYCIFSHSKALSLLWDLLNKHKTLLLHVHLPNLSELFLFFGIKFVLESSWLFQYLSSSQFVQLCSFFHGNLLDSSGSFLVHLPAIHQPIYWGFLLHLVYIYISSSDCLVPLWFFQLLHLLLLSIFSELYVNP